jgi:hypothetical protein
MQENNTYSPMISGKGTSMRVELLALYLLSKRLSLPLLYHFPVSHAHVCGSWMDAICEVNREAATVCMFHIVLNEEQTENRSVTVTKCDMKRRSQAERWPVKIDYVFFNFQLRLRKP